MIEPHPYDQWLYFGCADASGHHIFHSQSMSSTYSFRLLTNYDGSLAPQHDRTPYIAAISRIAGLGSRGMSALSWWDNTVDTRPGSNSIIWAPGIDLTPAQMQAGGELKFPWVFVRLPQPLKILGER